MDDLGVPPWIGNLHQIDIKFTNYIPIMSDSLENEFYGICLFTLVLPTLIVESVESHHCIVDMRQ